jgi:hypothetical protein
VTGEPGQSSGSGPTRRRRNRTVLAIGAAAALVMAALMTVIAVRAVSSGVLSMPVDAGPAAGDATRAAPQPDADAAAAAAVAPDDPEVARLLAVAQQAFVAGRRADAASVARRSQVELASPHQREAALVLLVEIACRQHDLDAVKVPLGKLGPARQRDLIKACASDGLIVPP